MGTGEKKMKICVFGLWHLGSVTSAGLAKLGHEVIGLDFNPELIKDLLDARAPISEPGLNELIHDCFRRKTLNFTTDPSFALEDAEVLWVTFDTPVDEQDNADVHSIEKKFDSVARLYSWRDKNYPILPGTRWVYSISAKSVLRKIPRQKKLFCLFSGKFATGKIH